MLLGKYFNCYINILLFKDFNKSNFNELRSMRNSRNDTIIDL